MAGNPSSAAPQVSDRPEEREAMTPFRMEALSARTIEYALGRSLLPGLMLVLRFSPTSAVAFERFPTYADPDGWIWFHGLQLPCNVERSLEIPWGLRSVATLKMSNWTAGDGGKGHLMTLTLPRLGTMKVILRPDTITTTGPQRSGRPSSARGANGCWSLSLLPGVSIEQFQKALVKGPCLFARFFRHNPAAALMLGSLIPQSPII